MSSPVGLPGGWVCIEGRSAWGGGVWSPHEQADRCKNTNFHTQSACVCQFGGWGASQGNSLNRSMRWRGRGASSEMHACENMPMEHYLRTGSQICITSILFTEPMEEIQITVNQQNFNAVLFEDILGFCCTILRY